MNETRNGFGVLPNRKWPLQDKNELLQRKMQHHTCTKPIPLHRIYLYDSAFTDQSFCQGLQIEEFTRTIRNGMSKQARSFRMP
jgi:hypothetical protein